MYVRIYIFHEFVLEHALGNKRLLYPVNLVAIKWANEETVHGTGTKWNTRRNKIKRTSKARQRAYNVHRELSTRPIMPIHKSWFQQDWKCYCVCVRLFSSIHFFRDSFSFLRLVQNIESCSFDDEQKHLILNCWSFLFSAFHAFNQPLRTDFFSSEKFYWWQGR